MLTTYQLGCTPLFQKTLTSQFTHYSTHQHGRFYIILLHVCVCYLHWVFMCTLRAKEFFFYEWLYIYILYTVLFVIIFSYNIYIYILWCFCLLWRCVQSQKHHCKLLLWGTRNPKQQRSPNHQQFLGWRLECKCAEDEISVPTCSTNF